MATTDEFWACIELSAWQTNSAPIGYSWPAGAVTGLGVQWYSPWYSVVLKPVNVISGTGSFGAVILRGFWPHLFLVNNFYMASMASNLTGVLSMAL